MTSEDKNSEGKNTIGAFTTSKKNVTDSFSKINPDGSPITITTLDERLDKISQPTDATTAFQETSMKGIGREGTKEQGSVSKEEEVFVEIRKEQEKEAEQPKKQVEKESSFSDENHTISGGKETLKELKKKNATSVIEKRKYSTLGIPTAKVKPPTEEFQEESSLFVLFFKIAVFIIAGFLGLSFASPSLLTYLVDKQYLQKVDEGVYSYNHFTFSNIFSEHILYTAVVLAVVSFVSFFIAIFVDVLVGKSIFLFAKVFIFVIITIFLGVLVFYLQINGTDVLGMVMEQLSVFR